MPRALEKLNGTRATLHPAECVTIIAAASEERIHGAMVYIDREAGLVHILDHLGETHLYTAPVGRTIIEWRRSSERGGERIATHAVGA